MIHRNNEAPIKIQMREMRKSQGKCVCKCRYGGEIEWSNNECEVSMKIEGRISSLPEFYLRKSVRRESRAIRCSVSVVALIVPWLL